MPALSVSSIVSRLVDLEGHHRNVPFVAGDSGAGPGPVEISVATDLATTQEDDQREML
jgi:hypothetical protein